MIALSPILLVIWSPTRFCEPLPEMATMHGLEAEDEGTVGGDMGQKEYLGFQWHIPHRKQKASRSQGKNSYTISTFKESVKQYINGNILTIQKN
jgi:hypothetical protein